MSQFQSCLRHFHCTSLHYPALSYWQLPLWGRFLSLPARAFCTSSSTQDMRNHFDALRHLFASQSDRVFFQALRCCAVNSESRRRSHAKSAREGRRDTSPALPRGGSRKNELESRRDD